MARKILFITTDQQRYDSLGCNGGKIARTPVVDGWARNGIRYTRAHCQNVVCMPSRSTMITGQYVATHGVWMNGVPLPIDAPSVARYLKEKAGYRTALIGKAHFEPLLDFDLKFYENQMASKGEFGPHRGFDHMELALHGPAGVWHYSMWLARSHPEVVPYFYPVMTRGESGLKLNAAGGGDTGAIQVKRNEVPREWYHTEWVADRTIAYLNALDQNADWFVWMSFPDPHHPWNPPASELHRVNWRDLDLPVGYPGSMEKARELLRSKPRHWLEWFEGRKVSNYEAPPDFVPAHVTPDQIREINAMVHIENELIDEACGRVWETIKARGWDNDTDIFFTTDHGELQGDFGLLFKGPYHVDALMRLPFIWRPAPNAHVAPAVVDDPIGTVDLAPTFCKIAGVSIADWMETGPLPASHQEAIGQRRERVITEWENEHGQISVKLKSIYRDGFLLTACEKCSEFEGTEGELYNLNDNPLQHANLWDDAGYRKRRDEMKADLYDNYPKARVPRLAAYASV